MFKQIIYLTFLLVLTSSIHFESLSKEKLQALRQHPDYQHHFIFFHQPILDMIKPDIQKWTISNSKVYINDCARNPLPQCSHPEQEPVVLLFNRILIRYNGDPKSSERISKINQEIIQWGLRRINSQPTFISSREQLDNYLNSYPNSFCFCQPPNRIEQSGFFYVLSKSLPHQSNRQIMVDYCIINNIVTINQLGLKENNVTLFLNNATNRREYQHPNRFQSWEWFVKNNMFPGIPRVSGIVGERFAHKESIQLIYIENLEAYILVCDFSINCDKAWQKLHGLQQKLNKQELGYDFYISLQDQKDSFAFNLYYHFTYDLSKLPTLAHISLKGNGQNSGTLVRHKQTIKQFTKDTLDQFITDIQKGSIQPIYFTAPTPKNNGFYGKGSQKFVQKLVASNAQATISLSQNHYILLVTALQINCQACEKFYKQYKQIASLLIDKDVTFGILNVNLNEVPIKQVTQLPELFLFKKDDKEHPIRMNVNHSFDHLMLFFKNNLGSSYSDPNEL